MNNTKKEKGLQHVYIIFILIIFCIILWRSLFGFDQSDESFYYALAKRLWLGDTLIINEWQPAQFYSPIVLIWYSIFRLIVHSDTGIILAGRITFLLLSLATAMFTFFVMRRKYSNKLAFLCSLPCLLYTKQNISGLGYGNLFLVFSWLSIDLILLFMFLNENKAKQFKGHRYLLVLSGECCSLCVLCMPYLAVFVIAGILIVSISFRKERDMQKELLFFILGILSIATVYILFLLSRGSIDNYIANFKYILGDPEYTTGCITNIYITAVQIVKLLGAPLLLTCFFLVYIFGIHFIKHRLLTKNESMMILVCVLAAIIYKTITVETGALYYTYIIISAYCLPIIFTLLIENHNDKQVVLFYLIGFLPCLLQLI